MFMDRRTKQEQGCERMQLTVKEQHNTQEAESKKGKRVKTRGDRKRKTKKKSIPFHTGRKDDIQIAIQT